MISSQKKDESMKAGHKVVAIIGAGNGGMAFAGFLGMRGIRVILSEFEEFDSSLNPVREKKEIMVTGVIQGTAKVEVAPSIAEAVSAADIVLATIPAHIHGRLAREIVTSLNQKTILVLNPGRTGGALEVYHILKSFGVDLPVVEAQTLLFACRKESATSVNINGIKNKVAVAVMPSCWKASAFESLQYVIPQFFLTDDVRSTSFANIGALFHTSMTLFNASRIDDGIAFEFYKDSATPHVSNVIQSMDRERLSIGVKAGISLISIRQWLCQSYGLKKNTLCEMIRNNPAYQGIVAPTSLDARYLHEDVPTGLVPMEVLGRMYQIGTPTITSIINLADVLMEQDYRNMGRCAKTMGIQNMNPATFHQYIRKGNIAVQKML